MIVRELISQGVIPVRRDDTVDEALSMALSAELIHLPVIDDDRLLVGMVRLSTLLEVEDVAKPVGELPFDAPFFVRDDAHVYEAIQLVIDHSSDLVPVTDSQGRYVGSIGLSNVLGPISELLSVDADGAVVEVEMPSRDFGLRHLIHAVEETGARIRSLGTVPSDSDEDRVLVVMKLSVEDTSRIRAVVEHLGYRVSHNTGREISDDELQHRVAEFMHYLDV